MRPRIQASGLSKTFTLHTQDGTQIPVFADLGLEIAGGGIIAVGRRADLVRVATAGDLPVATAVWREGRQVF